MTTNRDRALSTERAATPTVSRVEKGTIVELVYDADRRETALAVSRFDGLWNIEQETRTDSGELLVPYSATNNLIANQCVLLPSRPEHHGDKQELLADLCAFLNRYVDLSADFIEIAAHYALLSWVHDAFNELPYLRLQGDYGTGKTRGLIAIGSICYKPFFASGASTVSPIFHILNAFGGTLVLDEADFRFSDATSDLVKILNNGTMRGLPLLRTMQNRHGELNPRAFQVFGPKVVAMRGSYEDEALESRFFTENMNTRRVRSDIPSHLPNALRAEALQLRNKLLHFRFCELARTAIDPSALIFGAEPRVNQVALPLLSVMDDADARSRTQQALLSRSTDSSRKRSNRLSSLVFAALVEAFEQVVTPTILLSEIVVRVNAMAEVPTTTKTIGRIIRRQFGLKPYKSNGVSVLSRAERPAIESLAREFGFGDTARVAVSAIFPPET